MRSLPERVVKLTLAYHGALFKGWQTQRDRQRTVQSVLEGAVQKTFGSRLPVIAASRTDAGVHAEGQAAHLKVTTRLTAWQIRNALNFHLPDDIAVSSVRFMPGEFHARFMTRRKIYRYRILNSRVKPVFGLDTGLWVPQPLDVAAMRRAASFMVGRHDFSAFAGPEDNRVNRVRTMDRVSVRRQAGRVIEITVSGNGFLHHMVRLMAGTLIEVGLGKKSADQIPDIIRSKDRNRAGVMAKAHGLALIRIYY